MQRGTSSGGSVRGRRLVWGLLLTVGGVLAFAYIVIHLGWLQQRSPYFGNYYTDNTDPVLEDNNNNHNTLEEDTTIPLSHQGNATHFPSDEGVPASEKGPLKFTVIVLAYDRGASLKRLLVSLFNSDYEGDTVDIILHVDYPQHASDRALVAKNKECRQIVRQFRWPYGRKVVNLRSNNAGLRHSWFQAFYPPSNDDVGTNTSLSLPHSRTHTCYRTRSHPHVLHSHTHTCTHYHVHAQSHSHSHFTCTHARTYSPSTITLKPTLLTHNCTHTHLLLAFL